MQNLNRISKIHSYEEGFNGTLSIYRFRKIMKIINKYDIKRSSVLDLGCGEGMIFTELVKLPFKHVVGVDASESYIRKLKRKLKHIDKKAEKVRLFTTRIGDFCPGEQFDFIIASGILEHVLEPVHILRRMKSMLKRSGRIIVIVPNALSFHRLLGVKMGIIENEYTLTPLDIKVGHRRYYDREKLVSDAVEAGLEVIESGGIMFKPFDNSRMQSLPEDIIEGLYKLGDDFPDNCAEIYLVLG
jgi:2-polyprenyl-3-methyl-5-hydroxy-6-metoxy-1,4-benzoquinol methylase